MNPFAYYNVTQTAGPPVSWTTLLGSPATPYVYVDTDTALQCFYLIDDDTEVYPPSPVIYTYDFSLKSGIFFSEITSIFVGGNFIDNEVYCAVNGGSFQSIPWAGVSFSISVLQSISIKIVFYSARPNYHGDQIALDLVGTLGVPAIQYTWTSYTNTAETSS